MTNVFNKAIEQADCEAKVTITFPKLNKMFDKNRDCVVTYHFITRRVVQRWSLDPTRTLVCPVSIMLVNVEIKNNFVVIYVFQRDANDIEAPENYGMFG